jgi:hypothetical protein
VDVCDSVPGESSKIVAAVVADPKRPILIVGAQGTGKSTVLGRVAAEFRAMGRPVIAINLRRIRDEDELQSKVLQAVREQRILPPGQGLPSVFRRDLRRDVAASDLLRDLPVELVVILDGLDEADRPMIIGSFLYRLAKGSPATFLVASREPDPASSSRRSRWLADLVSLHDFQVLTVFENCEDLLRPYRSSARAPSKRPNRQDASPVEDALTEALARSDNPDLLDRSLGVLALGEPMPPFVLSGLLGVDVQLLDELLPRPLVKQDEDGLRIAHPSFSTFLQDRLLQSSVSYAELSFGNAAAEQDGLLSRLFQTPPILDSIRAGGTTVVIGERGAGKSALHRRLAEGSRSTEDVVVAAVKDHYEFLQHRLDDGETTVSAEDFKAFWLLFKAIVVAKEMLAHGLLDGCPVLRRDAIRMLKGFGLDAPLARRSGVLRALQWLGGRFRAPIRLSVGPVMVDADFSADLGPRKIDVYEFLRSASRALTDLAMRLVIVVDQVDEVYKYDRERQERAVQGLFLAEKFISEELGTGIRSVILLRSDLFRLFNIQEKNKLVGRLHELSWEESALVEFVLRRVLQNPGMQRLRTLIRPTNFGESETSRLL